MGESKDTGSETNHEGERGICENPKRHNKSRKAILFQKALGVILDWKPISLDYFKKMDIYSQYLDDDLAHDSKLRKEVLLNAWEKANATWQKKSLDEIIISRKKNMESFLHQQKNYYGLEWSAKLIGRLILEQMHSWTEAMNFCENIFTVLDRKGGKKNAIIIISPPSAGKTFIFQSLCDLLWSYTKIENKEKNGSDFNYMDLVDKRVAYWQECCFAGTKDIETAKLVFEGSPAKVKVKHQGPGTVEKTPMLVDGNKEIWTFAPESKKAFLDRSFYFKWQTQPWLEHVRRYPVPLAWEIIKKEYVNAHWWNTLPDKEDFQDRNATHIIPEDISFELWLKTYNGIKDQQDYDSYNDFIKQTFDTLC